MDLKQLALQVVTIAEQASEAILKIYHASEGITIDRKADNSPLTAADRTANEVICNGLEQLEHQFPIISEEKKQLAYEDRKDYEYFWLVDPLDGTKEFIKRNGEFTVNIALVKGNRPILGVVVTPVLQESFWAVKGLGAYLIKDGQSTKLMADSFTLADKKLGVVCSRSHLNEGTKAFIAQLNEPTLVTTGSSLKFLVLAQGKAHIYPRLAPTMEWDTCAAEIILEEAGGQVLHNETQKPLQYNKENLLNSYFIAYGKLV